MPDLVEKQVRDAVVLALTGLTTTGANISTYRFQPVAETDLPALVVYTDDEEITVQTLTMGSTRVKAHALDVRIEVLVKQASTAENTIALIYKEVITALEADPTLTGLVRDLINTSNKKDINEDGDQPAIAGIMTWEAQYQTRQGAPDVST